MQVDRFIINYSVKFDLSRGFVIFERKVHFNGLCDFNDYLEVSYFKKVLNILIY